MDTMNQAVQVASIDLTPEGISDFLARSAAGLDLTNPEERALFRARVRAMADAYIDKILVSSHEKQGF